MKKPTWHPLISMAAAALLLLLMAFIPAGCGFDFNFSCGETSSEIETYTSPGYGYSFQYPGDWELREDSSVEVTSGIAAAGSVSVFDPSGSEIGGSYVDMAEVSVYELDFTFDESLMPDIKTELERVLTDLATQDATWKTVEPLSETKVGGLSGYKATVTYMTDDSPMTSTLYFVFNGNIQYELMLQAASDNWDERQAEFDAIVASFTPEAVPATTEGTSR
jgi:hypothetical protein